MEIHSRVKSLPHIKADKPDLPLPQRRANPGKRANQGQVGLFGLTICCFFLSFFLPGQLFGFNLAGWLWVVILLSSSLILALRPTLVSFPVILWIPWAAYLCTRVQDWSLLGVQSTVQTLLPVGVAAAASTVEFSEGFFKRLDLWVNVSFLWLLGIFALQVLPWALADVENSGWITGGIIALFFQSYFLCRFLLLGGRRRDLVYTLASISIPVLLTLRGPVLGALALCVFVVAPFSIGRRIAIGAFALLLGIGAFYSPRFQTKMFYSGQGSLADLRKDNQDLNTSGRSAMKDIVEAGLDQNVWLGHGANTAGQALLAAGMTNGQIHNDWLRIRHDDGRFGVLLFAATIGVQILLLCYRARRASSESKVLIFSAASCFVPFVIVLFTDNILVYCQYFTAPHFCLIGYAYAQTSASIPKIRNNLAEFVTQNYLSQAGGSVLAVGQRAAGLRNSLPGRHSGNDALLTRRTVVPRHHE